MGSGVLESKLTLIETDDEILVVWDNDPADWVARFKKTDQFPARSWAERMQSLYADQVIQEDEVDGSV